MGIENKQQSLLTFRVGPVLCCAPSLPVRSIITPPKLTQTPGSDSSQPGIFKHGSHIVKVLDLRKKFGIDQAEQTQPGNLIITIFEKESFAFWVDQILDVFDFPSEGWGNIPAAIPRGIFTRTLLLNNKIHLYSEFENLATIQDLGYLKHYIQQLKEQNEKKAEPKKVDTPIILKSSNTVSESKKETVTTISPPTTNNDKPEKYLGTSHIASASKNKTIIESKVLSNTDTLKEKTSSTIERRPPPRTPIQKNNTLKKASVKTTNQNTKAEPIYRKPEPIKHTSVINKSSPTSSLTKQPHVPEFKKIKTHTPQPETQENINDEESSSVGLILFFLILFGMLGTGIYFFLPEKITTTSEHEKQIVEDSSDFILQPTPQEPSEIPKVMLETKPAKEAIVETSINKSAINKTTIEETLIQKPTTEETNALSQNEKEIQDDLYRADISQQNNEITITLHQPISSVENISEKEKVVEQKIEVETKEETIADSPVEPLKIKEVSPPIAKEKIINEVVHTVVKGDTLWAIAKKYVNNPFLYPELARLSNIKNPHRIYPGNRVRIRFIKN